MKAILLAALGVASLAAAALVPTATRAAGIWVDGNWYAACPPYLTLKTLSVVPSVGWEGGFAPYYPPTPSYGKIALRSAYVVGKTCRCQYEDGRLRLEAFQEPPSPYTRCAMYSYPWFICTR